MTTIFIFDDHAMLRQGLKATFSDKKEFTLGGEADNINKAKKIIDSYKDNKDETAVAIVDVGFTGENENVETTIGFELAAYISSSGKNIKVIMFSSYCGGGYIQYAMNNKCRASGYVSKQSAPEVLMQAVREVASGGTYIEQRLVREMMLTKDIYTALTPKEKEVLYYIQKEYSTDAISMEMNISPRTVENHFSRIYDKTGTRNCTELVNMFGRL